MMVGEGVDALEESRPLSEFCTAVAEDLEFLAFLHDQEASEELLGYLRDEGCSSVLGLVLKTDEGIGSLDFFDRHLKALPGEIDGGLLDDLAADYASIYLNYGISASPEESVWIDEESLACQTTMFQVRSCYEKHGLGVEDWRRRPDDHLVVELQFLQFLFEKGPDATLMKEAARFMDEHLLRWLKPFSSRVSTHCDTPFYAGAALVTACYCEELRDLLAGIVGEERPTAEEIDMRMKPAGISQEVSLKYVPGVGPAV